MARRILLLACTLALLVFLFVFTRARTVSSEVAEALDRTTRLESSILDLHATLLSYELDIVNLLLRANPDRKDLLSHRSEDFAREWATYSSLAQTRAEHKLGETIRLLEERYRKLGERLKADHESLVERTLKATDELMALEEDPISRAVVARFEGCLWQPAARCAPELVEELFRLEPDLGRRREQSAIQEALNAKARLGEAAAELANLRQSLDDLLNHETHNFGASLAAAGRVRLAELSDQTATLAALPLVLLVVVLVSLWRVIVLAARALEDLASSAAAISAGDFTQTLAERGPADLIGVVREFNHMALKLQTTMVSRDRLERSEEALLQAAKEWNDTFDALDEGVIVVDRDGRVHRLNEAARKLMGRLYAEVLERPLRNFAGHEPLNTAASLAEVAFRGRGPFQQLAQAGSPLRTWSLSASILFKSGLPSGLVILIREVSELVRLQEAAVRNQQLAELGTFVGGVAHEVRNPLFGITANLELWEAQAGADDETRDYLRRIRGEVERLSGLMQDLLELGRPSSIELVPGDFDQVVQEAVIKATPLADRSGVQIELSGTQGLAPLPMDQRRLVQAILNVVQNAIAFSPEGSTVKVRVDEGPTTKRGSSVRCTIEDQGSGFSEHDLPHLLEPFYSRRSGGTGLGLSIVNRTVTEHGGTLSFENRIEGGARVIIELPIPAEAAP